MHQYTWNEYYEKFYDWAESTQVRNLSGLTSLGSSDEVGEIIIELQVNVPAANRLLRKAVEERLAFSASDLIEFFCTNDKALATAALYNSVGRLSANDMEDMCGFAEDEDIIRICKKNNLALPEDLRDEEEYENEEECEDEEPEEIVEEPLEEVDIYVEEYSPPQKGSGFFAALVDMIAGIDNASDPNRHRHNGRCNGDCAHCPPHYGYRYNRWYYGHDHVHGCEFGGNKGSGRID